AMHKSANPGRRFAVHKLLVHLHEPIGVAAFLPGVGTADADKIAFVTRTLAKPSIGRANGVEASVAPHRHQKARADPAVFRVILGTAIYWRLNAAVEIRFAQTAQADGRNVEVR